MNESAAKNKKKYYLRISVHADFLHEAKISSVNDMHSSSSTVPASQLRKSRYISMMPVLRCEFIEQ